MEQLLIHFYDFLIDLCSHERCANYVFVTSSGLPRYNIIISMIMIIIIINIDIKI